MKFIKSKQGKAMLIIISLFAGGCLLVFEGLAKGYERAIDLSKPSGATFWSAAEEFIHACTYVPAIAGISLILLAVIFSSIVFWKWYKEG